jgi:hypothetical protein
MALDIAVVYPSGAWFGWNTGRNARAMTMIPRCNRIGWGPQAYPLCAGFSLKLRQVLVFVVLFEVPCQTCHEKLFRDIFAVNDDPGNQSTVPVIAGWPDLRSFAKYETGCELLGLLAEVLTKFRTVYAFEPHLDCAMVSEDLDCVSVFHPDTSRWKRMRRKKEKGQTECYLGGIHFSNSSFQGAFDRTQDPVIAVELDRTWTFKATAVFLFWLKGNLKKWIAEALRVFGASATYRGGLILNSLLPKTFALSLGLRRLSRQGPTRKDAPEAKLYCQNQ